MFQLLQHQEHRSPQHLKQFRLSEKLQEQIAAFLAIIVVTGSLSSLIMFQARVEYKCATEGYWWKSWGKVHPVWKTPYVSMLWQSGFAIVLVFATTLQTLLGYFTLICLIRNVLCFCTWFKVRKKSNYHRHGDARRSILWQFSQLFQQLFL